MDFFFINFVEFYIMCLQMINCCASLRKGLTKVERSQSFSMVTKLKCFMLMSRFTNMARKMM